MRAPTWQETRDAARTSDGKRMAGPLTEVTGAGAEVDAWEKASRRPEAGRRPLKISAQQLDTQNSSSSDLWPARGPNFFFVVLIKSSDNNQLRKEKVCST